MAMYRYATCAIRQHGALLPLRAMALLLSHVEPAPKDPILGVTEAFLVTPPPTKSTSASYLLSRSFVRFSPTPPKGAAGCLLQLRPHTPRRSSPTPPRPSSPADAVPRPSPALTARRRFNHGTPRIDGAGPNQVKAQPMKEEFPLMHPGQLAGNPALGLPLQLGHCDSCGATDLAECKDMICSAPSAGAWSPCSVHVQGDRAGVRLRVHLLHHQRGERQVLEGVAQDQQRRRPALGYGVAGV